MDNQNQPIEREIIKRWRGGTAADFGLSAIGARLELANRTKAEPEYDWEIHPHPHSDVRKECAERFELRAFQKLVATGITVFVLPAQEDITSFHAGKSPTNLLVRHFANEAELDAYKNGMECLEDQFDEIDELNVVGNKVSFIRPTDDEDDDADVTELVFSSPAEAQACREGIEDAEGMQAPLIVESDDPGYDRLAACEAARAVQGS